MYKWNRWELYLPRTRMARAMTGSVCFAIASTRVSRKRCCECRMIRRTRLWHCLTTWTEWELDNQHLGIWEAWQSRCGSKFFYLEAVVTIMQPLFKAWSTHTLVWALSSIISLEGKTNVHVGQKKKAGIWRHQNRIRYQSSCDIWCMHLQPSIQNQNGHKTLIFWIFGWMSDRLPIISSYRDFDTSNNDVRDGLNIPLYDNHSWFLSRQPDNARWLWWGIFHRQCFPLCTATGVLMYCRSPF